VIRIADQLSSLGVDGPAERRQRDVADPDRVLVADFADVNDAVTLRAVRSTSVIPGRRRPNAAFARLKRKKVIARPTLSRHARHYGVNLLPALELRMSSRMSAEFRSSELLLELGFARVDGIIGTSSIVIAMNRCLHIRSKVTVMQSPSLDSQTTQASNTAFPRRTVGTRSRVISINRPD
jgi:hypothetical protein